MRKLFFFTIVIMLSSCINQSKMIEFKPVIYNDMRQLSVYEKPVEKGFYKNLILVLEQYNIEYDIRNEIVFIKEDVYKDKELMMNFTVKAMDKEWLEQVQKNTSN